MSRPRVKSSITGDLAVQDRLMPQVLTDAAYQVFRYIVAPASFFFVELGLLHDRLAAGKLGEFLPYQAAQFIVHYLKILCARLPASSTSRAIGFEFWVGITARRGHSSYLHLDHDESLRRLTGEIICPMIGTIFHLGPAKGLKGGGTLFDLEPPAPSARVEGFRVAPFRELRHSAHTPVVVRRRQGRLIIFRGDLPHAVEPISRSDEDSARVTLMANLWDQRISSVPSGICSISAQSYRPLRLDLTGG